jgi:hypothetical protein
MTVSHEIKSQLAKLLATEDLVVENKNVETACFNVHTRVLTLPNWKNATPVVYDLLVGHEVGHALYTPNIDWIVDRNIPPQFVNVVEDVRIEKLMKRRYPGISKSFWKGYEELSDDDFFQIKNEDLTSINLADKINIHYKIGKFVDVPFENDQEKDLMKRSGETETFEEVLDIAEEIYKYCLDKKEQESKINFDNHGTQGASGGEEGEGEEEQEQEYSASGDDSESSGSDESEDGEMPDINDQQQGMSGGETSVPDVKTMSAFDDAVRENLLDQDARDNVYVELPELDLKQIIIPNSKIHQLCEEQWSEESTPLMFFQYVDEAFNKFKRSAQKEVNYLVKEFECRKSAAAYARASTSKTGVLDCTKLHTYKYNEDLFKKVTTFADGKNHGLVFVLDWSGSMGNVMLDTMKQLFNLVWFCKKVGIPFDVYAFTNDYPRDDGMGIAELSYEKKDGLVRVGESFSMLHFLTSKVKGKELEQQILHMFRMGYHFSSNWGVPYTIPVGLYLSGTPLNEALITLKQIIPQFKSQNNLEKVQCVILTDGEAPPLKYHKEFLGRKVYDTEPYLGVNSLNGDSFIRDRKTGHTYSMMQDWNDQSRFSHTGAMLKLLRNRMPSVNFIGIRVLATRDANCFIRQHVPNFNDYAKIQRQWKKDKSFTLTESGYHKYFGLSASAMNQDTDFEVKEDATKTQIKTAFVKSLRTKKMNKKVLGEFIELIA